ncbi:unnamed protein product, partial [Rotaria sp. Silwood1]
TTTCGECTVNVHNIYTNATQVVLDDNVGYYSCSQFCTGSLSSGASGAQDPLYNYANDAATALGGVTYTCKLAWSNTNNCVNSYGTYTNLAGNFYLTNRGVCSNRHGYRCCCRSTSG